MKETHLLIVGIARDIDVQHCRNTVEDIGNSVSGDYRAFFYENDSTKSVVFDFMVWARSNPRIQTMHATLNREGALYHSNRCTLMAEYRNHYVEWIRKQPSHFQTVAVLDPDVYVARPKSCVREVLELYNDDFDMIGARGAYDTYTYRDEQYPWGNELHEKGAPHHWSINIPNERKQVLSCFGGLGLYPRRIFEEFSYEDPGIHCEHTRLHELMCQRGYNRIYLEPLLEVDNKPSQSTR